MQIFDSFIEAGHTMNERDREQYYAAIIEYLYYGIEPDVKGAALAVITAIRPSLDKSRTRVVCGRAGGRTRKQNDENAESKTTKTQKAKCDFSEKQNDENAESKTQKNDQANSNSNSNKEVIPNGITKKAPKFEKPNADLVSSYAAERGCPNFDAERFIDHYESNGWRVGRNPMRDWRAAVRNWLRKDGVADTSDDLSPELQRIIAMQEEW